MQGLGSKALLLIVGFQWSYLTHATNQTPPKKTGAQAFATDDGWVEYKPGGRTLCARGSEFSFFVYPGDPKKVVIDFVGGGACWNAETCGGRQPTFVDSVEMVRREQRRGFKGIYDKTNPANPLAGWTHVAIPYCTGDIHWGDADTTYQRSDGSRFTINHRGAVNVEAVLNWSQNHFGEPEKVFLTGCSAGSYASVYWASKARKLFPSTQIKQLGDSGVGVVTPVFMENSLALWNVLAHGPTWLPGLDPSVVDWRSLKINDLYRAVKGAHPELSLAQYSSAEDFVQTFFFTLMQGTQDDWPRLMNQSFKDLGQTLPEFTYYRSEGPEHCILPYNYLYDTVADGVNFSSWLRNYINETGPSPQVPCQNCSEEPTLRP